jgi:hypothetical protein
LREKQEEQEENEKQERKNERQMKRKPLKEKEIHLEKRLVHALERKKERRRDRKEDEKNEVEKGEKKKRTSTEQQRKTAATEETLRLPSREKTHKLAPAFPFLSKKTQEDRIFLFDEGKKRQKLSHQTSLESEEYEEHFEGFNELSSSEVIYLDPREEMTNMFNFLFLMMILKNCLKIGLLITNLLPETNKNAAKTKCKQFQNGRKPFLSSSPPEKLHACFFICVFVSPYAPVTVLKSIRKKS